MPYSDKNCSLAYYYQYEGILGRCKGGDNDEDLQTRLNKWGSGDSINITVNCIKWTITFERNGKNVGQPISILERDVYYPALQMCQCEGNSFSVMDLQTSRHRKRFSFGRFLGNLGNAKKE